MSRALQPLADHHQALTNYRCTCVCHQRPPRVSGATHAEKVGRVSLGPVRTHTARARHVQLELVRSAGVHWRPCLFTCSPCLATCGRGSVRRPCAHGACVMRAFVIVDDALRRCGVPARFGGKGASARWFRADGLLAACGGCALLCCCAIGARAHACVCGGAVVRLRRYWSVHGWLNLLPSAIPAEYRDWLMGICHTTNPGGAGGAAPNAHGHDET